MGLKYIEPMKSFILLLLVLLSVFLSFSIWNFMPGYETIDKQPSVDISISAQKRIDEVVKPYKLLVNFEDGLKGTEDSLEIDRVFDSIRKLSIDGLSLSQKKMNVQSVTEVMRKPDQFVFFYPSGVPFKVMDNIVTLEDSNIPEESFTKMIVNWSRLETEHSLQFYFLNDQEKMIYIAEARGVDPNRFTNRLLKDAKNYDSYTEIRREDNLSLYVSQEGLDLPENTYLLSEVNPDQFKKALFPDPNVVRGNSVTLSTEEYLDDSSKLTVDTTNKWLSYVNPGEESKGIALPSELIFNSIDFINEHGGWTDDYRFWKIDPINKEVSFGLNISGYPAFSDTKMKTVIQETWGESDIFRYTRPYYDLGMPLPSENPLIQLPSGKGAADVLASIRELDFQSVEEIKAGYNISISQRQDQRLIIAEPSYYYLVNGNWLRLTPEMLGGGPLGLE